MRASVTLLVAVLCMAYAKAGRAAPFELDWSASPDCPSREQIVRATRVRLGEADASAPPELFVRGSVERNEDGAFAITLTVKNAAGDDLGERHVVFDERTCAEIEDPTALVLAMMIAVASPTETAPPVEPPPPSVAVPAPRASPRVSAATPNREPRRVRFALGASGITSLGLLPNIGFGFALRGTLTFASRLVLGAEASFETAAAAEASSRGEAQFRLYDGAVLAGYDAVRTQLFEVVPIVEARGGILEGTATGFPVAFEKTRAIAMVGAGVLGRARLRRGLYLEVMSDLRIPLTRDQFQVRDEARLVRVHKPAPVDGRLALGIGWEF